MGKRPVIFCATQRSGSTMVFEDFLSTRGLARRPHELMYGMASGTAVWPSALPKPGAPGSWGTWLIDQVVEREGFFSDKIMFHSIPLVMKSLFGTEEPARALDEFHSRFADAVWVYIYRADIFAQCVSKYMAEKTGKWDRRQVADADPKNYNNRSGYDIKALRQHFRSFSSEREGWTNFFNRHKIKPIEIVYEDAVERFPYYLSDVLNEIGIEMPSETPVRQMAKLGNDTNKIYADMMRDQFLYDLAQSRLDRWVPGMRK